MVLIIISGESNAGGIALNSEAPGGEIGLQTSVKILNPSNLLFEDLVIGGASENNLLQHTGLEAYYQLTHGMELEIAKRVKDGTFGLNPIHISKTGQGGTTISDWAVGATYSGTNSWQVMQDRVDAAIAAMTLANGGVPPQLFLFYSQGINDAIAGTPTSTWKTATAAHFAKIRARWGFMPIFMTKLPADRAAFNTAIDELTPTVSDCFSVVTSDLPVYPDGNHWNYTAMKTLTDRLINTLMANYSISGNNGGGQISVSTVKSVPAFMFS